MSLWDTSVHLVCRQKTQMVESRFSVVQPITSVMLDTVPASQTDLCRRVFESRQRGNLSPTRPLKGLAR